MQNQVNIANTLQKLPQGFRDVHKYMHVFFIQTYYMSVFDYLMNCHFISIVYCNLIWDKASDAGKLRFL